MWLAQQFSPQQQSGGSVSSAEPARLSLAVLNNVKASHHYDRQRLPNAAAGSADRVMRPKHDAPASGSL
jgi:hypothetical protein